MTDATAQALAGETAAPVSDTAESIFSAPDAASGPDEAAERAALDAIWDKASAEPEGDSAGEGENAPDEGAINPIAEPAEPAPAPVKAPYDLPAAYNDIWGDLNDKQRETLTRSYREASNKWGEIGRQVKGIEPIRDVLVKAAREIPGMADMSPQEVAEQVFELAGWAQRLNADPASALKEIADAKGINLSGEKQTDEQAASAALRAQIARLEQRLEQASNPEFLANQVTQITTQQRLQGEIDSFSASREHWGTVEPHMPAAISIAKAKLGQSASATDVLSAAYDLAVSQFVTSPTAPPAAAATAAPQRDPQKAREAKSINVTSAPSAKAPLTERQLMEQVWAKHHAR